MPDKIFKAVSLAVCSKCGEPGLGKVYITGLDKPELELWEPDGWFELPDKILCGDCYYAGTYKDLGG